MVGSSRSADWLLPQVIRDVAEVIGRRQAFVLAGAICPPKAGGRESDRGRSGSIYIPVDLSRSHGKRLIAIVGRGDAERMSSTFGGIVLQIPSCEAFLRYHRNVAIRRMISNGWSVAATSWAFNVCERTVRNLIRRETVRPVRSS